MRFDKFLIDTRRHIHGSAEPEKHQQSDGRVDNAATCGRVAEGSTRIDRSIDGIWALPVEVFEYLSM